jgi:hypothetical protein
MKLKFKTLYDPKQKCFIHLQNFGDVFTSSTPNLMKETATMKKIKELYYNTDLNDYKLIDIEISGEFEIE